MDCHDEHGSLTDIAGIPTVFVVAVFIMVLIVVAADVITIFINVIMNVIIGSLCWLTVHGATSQYILLLLWLTGDGWTHSSSVRHSSAVCHFELPRLACINPSQASPDFSSLNTAASLLSSRSSPSDMYCQH